MSGTVSFFNDPYYNMLDSFLSVINTPVHVLLVHILRLISGAFSTHLISNFANNEILLINQCNFIEQMFVYLNTFYECK